MVYEQPDGYRPGAAKLRLVRRHVSAVSRLPRIHQTGIRLVAYDIRAIFPVRILPASDPARIRSASAARDDVMVG